MEKGEIRFHQKRRKHGGENRVASARDLRKYCQMLRRKCCSEKIGLVRKYWWVSAGCCCLVQGAEQLQSGQPLGMRSLRATAHCMYTLHTAHCMNTAHCTLHTLHAAFTLQTKLYYNLVSHHSQSFSVALLVINLSLNKNTDKIPAYLVLP